MDKDKENISLDKVMVNGLSPVSTKTIVGGTKSECQNCKKCSCKSQKLLDNFKLDIKDYLKK
jgi:hypothetical protein